jgi:hypothetical protein
MLSQPVSVFSVVSVYFLGCVLPLHGRLGGASRLRAGLGCLARDFESLAQPAQRVTNSLKCTLYLPSNGGFVRRPV